MVIILALAAAIATAPAPKSIPQAIESMERQMHDIAANCYRIGFLTHELTDKGKPVPADLRRAIEAGRQACYQP